MQVLAQFVDGTVDQRHTTRTLHVFLQDAGSRGNGDVHGLRTDLVQCLLLGLGDLLLGLLAATLDRGLQISARLLADPLGLLAGVGNNPVTV